MNKPYHLMTDRANVYITTQTRSGGALVNTLPDEPTYPNVPCMIQNAEPKVTDEYGRHDELVTHSIFCLNKTVYDAFKRQDLIEINSVKYEYVGKRDLAGRQRVFRIDVKEKQI